VDGEENKVTLPYQSVSQSSQMPAGVADIRIPFEGVITELVLISEMRLEKEEGVRGDLALPTRLQRSIPNKSPSCQQKSH
jgi:hypothetical protein